MPQCIQLQPRHLPVVANRIKKPRQQKSDIYQSVVVDDTNLLARHPPLPTSPQLAQHKSLTKKCRALCCCTHVLEASKSKERVHSLRHPSWRTVYLLQDPPPTTLRVPGERSVRHQVRHHTTSTTIILHHPTTLYRLGVARRRLRALVAARWSLLSQ